MKVPLKQTVKRFFPLISMLIFPVMGWLYALTNNSSRSQVYSLMTDLDRAFPFVKIFVFPYSVWIFYLYACLLYFFMKDPLLYIRTLITYVVCALLCYVVYMVFQTTVPRPVIDGSDHATKLLAFVYNRDQPYNCFPSIHCFSSYLVMKALYTSRFRTWLNQTLIYGMSSLIIISTFFIKQHTFLDAIAGIILAEFVFRLVTYMIGTRKAVQPAPLPQQRPLEY
ncbi:phosphatase PAP2 family protein [Paenibacillus solisilvae]|uniref:Phosphatase PAP2 family protein n=1 Tax=Paenibacillus solisilvae TaxID=2486751 RepID=A0ABW0W1L2_9BACL